MLYSNPLQLPLREADIELSVVIRSTGITCYILIRYNYHRKRRIMDYNGL